MIEGTAKTEYASLSGKIHTFVVDKTLSISGACADAKVVGDNIERLDDILPEAKEAYEEAKAAYDEAVGGMEEAARAVATEVAKEEVSKLTAGDVGAYSKAESVSDTTKALYGLGTDAVPDDVFGVLSRFHGGLGNEYVWAKIGTKGNEVRKSESEAVAYYTKKSGSYYATTVALEIPYSDEIICNMDGTVSLKNPQILTVTYDTYTEVNKLKGKYFYGQYLQNDGTITDYDTLLYVEETADDATIFSNLDNGYCFRIIRFQSGCYSITCTVSESVLGYVNSPDPNAYPIDDGYTYNLLGQLGGAARIATGSYVGTGTYGSSNPNSLTFDFEPKLLVVSPTSYTPVAAMLVATAPNTYGYGFCLDQTNNTLRQTQVTWSGKKVQWYNSVNGGCQQNNSGTTYNYVAIG